MAPLPPTPLLDATFEGRLVDGATPPTLRLTGTLAHAAPDQLLGPWFEQVHHYLTARREALVTVDLTGMVFMNSASFKTLLTWVTLMQAVPDSYRVRFRVDKKRRWQSTSVHALKCFAPSLIEMQEAV